MQSIKNHKLWVLLVVAVFLAASLVRPMPVVLGIFSFIFGQVIVRTIRKSRVSR